MAFDGAYVWACVPETWAMFSDREVDCLLHCFQLCFLVEFLWA